MARVLLASVIFQTVGAELETDIENREQHIKARKQQQHQQK